MQEATPPTRQQILILLKKRGTMAVTELTQELGISSVAVRQHLNILERDGLVATRQVRGGKGRPKTLYQLTEASRELFPQTHHQLALELLDELQRLYGSEAVEKLFQARLKSQKESYLKQISSTDLMGKVIELARIRDESGYMADWEEESRGVLLLKEHHCPIFHVAKKHQQACVCELELFRQVLGSNAKVERVCHAVVGDCLCSYRIKPKWMRKAKRRS